MMNNCIVKYISIDLWRKLWINLSWASAPTFAAKRQQREAIWLPLVFNLMLCRLAQRKFGLNVWNSHQVSCRSHYLPVSHGRGRSGIDSLTLPLLLYLKQKAGLTACHANNPGSNIVRKKVVYICSKSQTLTDLRHRQTFLPLTK